MQSFLMNSPSQRKSAWSTATKEDIIQGDACRYLASASPTSSQFPSNGQNQHYTTRVDRAVIMLDIGDIKDGGYRSLEQIIQRFLETARQGV